MRRGDLGYDVGADMPRKLVPLSDETMTRGPLHLLLAAPDGAAVVWPSLGAEPAQQVVDAAEPVDWNQLVARYDRRVVVALLARGARLDEAKEVAQDAWIRLVEQHRRGQLDEIRLPQLAIRQAQFFLADRRRKHRRRSALIQRFFPGRDASADEADDAVASYPLVPESEVERQLDARAQLRVVSDVLADSSTTAQAVFDGLYGRDPGTAAEVAAKLGLSVQRVRQVACELRAKMRKAWEGSDD